MAGDGGNGRGGAVGHGPLGALIGKVLQVDLVGDDEAVDADLDEVDEERLFLCGLQVGAEQQGGDA